jgi:hypothetical protein
MGLVTAKEVAKAINAEKYGIWEPFPAFFNESNKISSLMNFMTVINI